MSEKTTILIGSDNVNLKTSLCNILSVRGYSPVTVSLGQEALKRIHDNRPAIALIDLCLEDMSGLKLLKQIQAHGSNTECIMLTGYAMKISAFELLNLGAYCYMPKPYNIDLLLVMVHRAVEKHNLQQTIRQLHQQNE
jgi:DNA-binding NtrC family response regulator